MRELAARTVALVAALALVAGAVAAALGLVGLARGTLGVGGAVTAVAGVLVVVLVAREVPAPRLLGAYASLVYFALFFPIVVVVVYAFNEGRQLEVWEGFGTRWFATALADDSITSSIRRSLAIALCSALVATALGTAAALALAHARRGVRIPFDVLIFLTLVVPELVIAIASLIFFTNAGFELGTTTMFLAHTVFNASLVMLIVRSRFVTMGSQLEESSADLGAGPLATFRQVTFPRLFPAVLAGAMLSFTFSFDNVVTSNFTAGAGSQTWPLRVLNGLKFGLKPDVNATATMMLGVTLLGLAGAGLLLYWSARRQGQAGLGVFAGPAAPPPAAAAPAPAPEPAGARA